MSRGVPTKVMCLESGTVFDSLTECAAYIGTTVQNVSAACSVGTSLKGNHYKRVDRSKSLTRKQLNARNKRMLADRSNGMPIKDIAQKYGLSYQGAWRIVK